MLELTAVFEGCTTSQRRRGAGSQFQYVLSPSKLNWNANETETHCAAKQTTFREFPPPSVCCRLPARLFQVSGYGSSPNRGRSSPLFRPRADCGCGWDEIKTRCTRVSWRRTYAPPSPSSPRAPNKAVFKKSRARREHARRWLERHVYASVSLFCQKAPLPVGLARLVFSVLGDEFRQDRTSSGCSSAVHCGTCRRTPIICSSLAFFLQTVPTNGLTQSGFTVNLKRGIYLYFNALITIIIHWPPRHVFILWL